MKRLILCGYSASGKDYLAKELIAKGFNKSISYTTRPMRENEKEGRDYFYISREEFQDKIALNFWYEYVEFNNWIYGTSKEQMYKDNLFIMTPEGISKLLPIDRVESFIIFIDTPEDVRRLRLINRKQPGDTIDRRIEADRKDFENFTDYDLKIDNSVLSPKMIDLLMKHLKK